MIVIVSLTIFLGFYTLYNTSKKAKLNITKVDKWLQHYPKISKLISLILITGSFGLLMNYYGIGAGIFISFIILMTIGSMIIIITPLFSKRKK